MSDQTTPRVVPMARASGQGFGRRKALTAAIGALFSVDAFAATITVNSLADNTTSGDAQCTLREALANANANTDTTGGDCLAGSGADTINLSALSGTITLGGGRLSISDFTTVSGPGAGALSIDAASAAGIFYIYNNAATLDVTISGLTLTRGRASNGGALATKGERVTLDNVTLASNAATAVGGAVYAAGATLTIKNSTLSGNTAAGAGGGAVYGLGGTTSLLNSQATGNSASSISGRGGAVSVTSGGLVIADSVLSSDTSAGKGGAIAVKTSAAAQPTDIQRTQITSNSANGRGGALFLYRTAGTISISKTTISGNATQNRGGGLFLYNMFANVTIADSSIENNTANGTTGNGGGIFFYRSATNVDVTIQRSSISGNQTSRSGGGLFFYKGGGALVLESTTMTGNSAGIDGGAVFTRGPFGAAATLRLRSSTIARNSAVNNGGNLNVTAVPTSLRNTLLTQGTAAIAPDLLGGASNVSLDYSLIGNTSGATFSGANNLVSVDPLLSALGKHGGLTDNFLLSVSSPARDTGDPDSAALPATEQRGLARVANGRADIGSTETRISQLAFSIAPQSGAPTLTLVDSAPFLVDGVYDLPLTIYVHGGSYSVNGGPFTDAPGTVNAGDTIVARLLTANTVSTTTTATIGIGSFNASFNVTTTSVDAQPDALVFPAQTGAPRNTTATSAPATLSGINTTLPISVSGGTYSLNGGAFVSAAGTVHNGDVVRLSHTTSPLFGTLTATTVNIGGLQSSFYVLTQTADTTADAFSFDVQSNLGLNAVATSVPVTIAGINTPSPISVVGGSYSINGGAFVTAAGNVVAGDVVRARQNASSAFGTTTVATLSVGATSAPFSVTTLAADTVPDAFGFTAQTNVALGASVTSNAVTITGINTATPIAIVGGAYSINGGPFVSVAGSVQPNDSVTLRLAASADPATATTATLTVGGVNGAFTATTVAADTTPDAFAFAPQNDVALNASIMSAPISVAGLNTGAAIAIVGGSYSINGGAFVTTAGTVHNGDAVRVRVTASAAFSTGVSAQLSIGDVSATFAVTTLAADTTPDAFAFAAQTQVAQGTLATSAPAVIGGVNTATPISVTGGAYSIDGGAFVTDPGTVQDGATVRVQVAASSTLGVTTSAVLTVGGISASFDVTSVVADGVPDAFAFAAKDEVPLNSVAVSAPITLSGVNVPVAIGNIGGAYSIDGGAFTSGAGTVQSGASVTVRVNVTGATATPSTMQLSIGGVSAVFVATTVGPPTQLVFTTPPQDLVTGYSLDSVQIVQRDAAGSTVNQNGTLRLSVPACGSSVDLGTATLSNGVATFAASPVFYTVATGLVIDVSRVGFPLQGSSPPFDVLANPDLVFADGAEVCRL